MISLLRFAGAIAAGTLLAAPLAAQRHVPDTYAITGAKIVPVSGPALEQGTIVIRDGVIAAVGANVAVPADARIIDGAGLTVYPGFIDAYSSLGQATPAGAGAAAAAGRGGRGAAGATTAAAPSGAPNSNYPVGLQPEMQVVDALELEAGGFDAAHAAGVTAALTGAPDGNLPRPVGGDRSGRRRCVGDDRQVADCAEYRFCPRPAAGAADILAR